MPIQFDKDGVTLFYIDATGKRISHNFMEGVAYDDMLTVMGAQQQAARDNTQTIATYERTITDAEAAHDYTVHPKPLQKLVSDTGAVTFAPFAPPLRDMVVPAAAPSMGTVPKADVPDKQAIMYNMILAMFRKMFPDA